MPLTVDKYVILLASPEHPGDPEHAVEHEVYVLNGDRLRAELEGAKQGLGDGQKMPMHYMTICLWASCTRTKLTEAAFREFKDVLLNFDEVKDEGIDGTPPDETPADPTSEEGLTGSLSSSSTSSPAPTGEIPTSIPA